MTFLFAHTCMNDCNIAQAQIVAPDSDLAYEIFGLLYPNRKITVVGVR